MIGEHVAKIKVDSRETGNGNRLLHLTIPVSRILLPVSLFYPVRNPHLVRPVIVRRALEQRGRVERVDE